MLSREQVLAQQAEAIKFVKKQYAAQLRELAAHEATKTKQERLDATHAWLGAGIVEMMKIHEAWKDKQKGKFHQKIWPEKLGSPFLSNNGNVYLHKNLNIVGLGYSKVWLEFGSFYSQTMSLRMCAWQWKNKEGSLIKGQYERILKEDSIAMILKTQGKSPYQHQQDFLQEAAIVVEKSIVRSKKLPGAWHKIK